MRSPDRRGKRVDDIHCIGTQASLQEELHLYCKLLEEKQWICSLAVLDY